MFCIYSSPILCQDPKCSACKMDLDIPCIHFFCEHSFHEQLVLKITYSSLLKLFFHYLVVPTPLNQQHHQRLLMNAHYVRVIIGNHLEK